MRKCYKVTQDQLALQMEFRDRRYPEGKPEVRIVEDTTPNIATSRFYTTCATKINFTDNCFPKAIMVLSPSCMPQFTYKEHCLIAQRLWNGEIKFLVKKMHNREE